MSTKKPMATQLGGSVRLLWFLPWTRSVMAAGGWMVPVFGIAGLQVVARRRPDGDNGAWRYRPGCEEACHEGLSWFSPIVMMPGGSLPPGWGT
jgi:hypothetical protein